MRTEMKELTNVRKSCSTAKKVIKIISILVLVCMMVCLVGSVICFAFNSRINEAFSSPDASANVSASITVMDRDITDEVMNELGEDQYGLFFAVMALVGGLICGFVYAVLRIVRRIFDSILKSDSPFAPGTVKLLKRCFIVITVLVLLAEGISPALFLGLFFWCLYTIFQYGAVLQQQADETL